MYNKINYYQLYKNNFIYYMVCKACKACYFRELTLLRS